MSKSVRERLLQLFTDRSRLEWEDFFCENIEKTFRGQKEQVIKCFDILSRPWPDISWEPIDASYSEYDAIPISGCLLVFHLNQKGFAHVFPSILAEIAEKGFSAVGGGIGYVFLY